MKNINILIILLFLISCSQKGVINDYKIENNLVNKKEVLMLIFKRKITDNNGEYYITSVSNMGFIYNFPITSFIEVNGNPTLIYSKEDGFLSPDNYTNQFINYIKDFLYDDMLLESILIDENGNHYYEDISLFTSHPETWHIKNKKLDKNSKIDLIKEGLIYFNQDIELLKYYRVKKGGKDERK